MGSQVIRLPYFYKYRDWKCNSPRCYSVWHAIFYYVCNGYKDNHNTNISFPIYLRDRHPNKAEIITRDYLIQTPKAPGETYTREEFTQVSSDRQNCVWYCAVWTDFLIACEQLNPPHPEIGQAILSPAGVLFGRLGSATAVGRCSIQVVLQGRDRSHDSQTYKVSFPLFNRQLNVIAPFFKILSKSVSRSFKGGKRERSKPSTPSTQVWVPVPWRRRRFLY